MNWHFTKQVSHLATKCKIFDEYFRTVAIIDEDFEKSAPVIAAAPELLDALERCLPYVDAAIESGLGEHHNDATDAFWQAAAIIRKAKGEK